MIIYKIYSKKNGEETEKQSRITESINENV